MADRYGRSVHWLRKELRAYELPLVKPEPCAMVAVMDCVFFGRTRGYLVVRDQHRKVNVYWLAIKRETVEEYQCAKDTLEALGFTLKAVVSDGKPGLKRLFVDLPVQMCHYHQVAAIRRYLTMRPRLEAGRELKSLAHGLGDLCEGCFASQLALWHKKWREFIGQKTVNPETGRWHYTHKRLRSAYRSLKTQLPYLYTYKRHPDLGIPNTTNGLEGSFAYLKELVRVHRGMRYDLKRKMIVAILQNRPTNL